LTVAYNGAAYGGWQTQANRPTIQARLEAAFAALFGQPMVVEGAGRTDAGVHALAQCAHVDLPRPFPIGRLVPALNGHLPRDIVVRSACPVSSALHARFSAVGKRYAYRFVTVRPRPVLGLGYYHFEPRPLNLAAMRRAAVILLGEHDFASFASNPGYVRKRGTVRRIDHVHLARRTFGIDLFVQGTGFLYNMVRAIAGTLRDVGVGRHPPDRVADVLAARDRRAGGRTLPACGLYLVRVLYPRDLLPRSGPNARVRRLMTAPSRLLSSQDLHDQAES
jgi:tRNA pseudouridine38-40 synthase